MMVTWVRRGAVVALVSALLPVVSGVAVADPVTQQKDTVDGFRLTLTISDVNIQSVPNMAAAPLVREGFINATSRLDVECVMEQCKKAGEFGQLGAVTSLDMWAQVGCPMDLAGGTSVSLSPQIGGSIPIQDIVQAILPPVPTPVPNDITNIALAPTGGITPSVGVPMKPGYIRDVSLGSMKFPPDAAVLQGLIDSMDLGAKAEKLSKVADQGGRAPDSVVDNVTQRAASALGDTRRGVLQPLAISVRNFHMVVDTANNQLATCGGVVAVRIYAQAKISTAKSYDTVDIYGDIFTL